MPYQIDDQVVYPACGVGRIVGLVSKRLLEEEARLYYEVATEQSTVWVPVDAEEESPLRPLTARTDLARYRAVLTAPPQSLVSDSRQRRLELRDRLQGGAFQELCEVVRDLTARARHKPLNESDLVALRRARGALCEEWAAAQGVSRLEAAEEVDDLLFEGEQSRGP